MVGNNKERRNNHDTPLLGESNDHHKRPIKKDYIFKSRKMEEKESENSEKEESDSNINENRKKNTSKDNAESLNYYSDFLNNIFRCQYCKFSSTDKEELNQHRSVHSKEKQHRCSQCDYQCHYRADLIRHCAKHSDEKRYTCPHCDFATKWRRNVRHHLLKHTNERPYQCQICEFSFKRLQDLKYHMYRHNDEKPIKCDECEFCCKTNYELKCHKLKHSDVRQFPCTFEGCNQQCKTKSDLTKHLKTHNVEKNHICSLCGKGFTTAGCLNKHVQRHDTHRQFICHLCLKKFKSKASLKNHLKIHEGIRPFVCDICENTFTNKYNMMKHQETHGDNRPFRCPICPYGARSSGHLLAHIGSMHGHSYAYFCELCKKPFRRHGQLRIHLKRMHKGSKEATAAADFTHNSVSALPISTCARPSVSKSDESNHLNTNKTDSSNNNITKATSLPSTKLVKDPSSKDVSKSVHASDLDCEFVIPNKKKFNESKSDINNSDNDGGNQHVVVETNQVKPDETNLESFHLPLATKGFTFNFDKKGKKPRSWFMDPDYMPVDAAEKQKAYLNRKAISKLKKSETNETRKQKKLKIEEKNKQSVIVKKINLAKASKKKKMKLVKNLNNKKILRKKKKSKYLKKCISEGSKVKIESLRSDIEDDIHSENKFETNNKNNQLDESVAEETTSSHHDLHHEIPIPIKIKQEPSDDSDIVLNMEMPESPVKTVLFETLLKSEAREYNSALTESTSTESKVVEVTRSSDLTTDDSCNDDKSLSCNNSGGRTGNNSNPLSKSGQFEFENVSTQESDSNKTMLMYTISQEIVDTCQSSKTDIQINEVCSNSVDSEETMIKHEPLPVNNYSFNNQIKSSFNLNPDIKVDKNYTFLFDQEKLNPNTIPPSKTVPLLSESSKNNQDKKINDSTSTENLVGFEMIDEQTDNQYYSKPVNEKQFSLTNSFTNNFNIDNNLEKISTGEGKLTSSHNFGLQSSQSSTLLDKNVHNNCDSLLNSVSSTMESHYGIESVISQEVLPNHLSTSTSPVLSLHKLEFDDVTLPVSVAEKMSPLRKDPFQFSSNMDFGYSKYNPFLQTHSFHDISKCNDSNSEKLPQNCLSNATEKEPDLVYSPVFHSSDIDAQEAKQLRTSVSSMAFNSENSEINSRCPILLSTLNNQFLTNESSKETLEKIRMPTSNNILPKPPSDEAQALYEYEMEFDEKSILRDNINVTMFSSFLSENQEKTNPFSVFSYTAAENSNLLEMTINSDLNDNVTHTSVSNDINLIPAKLELDWDCDDNLSQNCILLNPS